MMRPVAALVVLCTAMLGGCHYARGIGYADTIPPGRPPFAAGTPEGYWIWQDRQGWHLRTTSDTPRHFRGVIEAIGGTPSAIHALGGAEGAVHRDGPNIEFEYDAAGGEQGFDWTSSSGCNRFDIYIDGTTRPMRVFLGWVEESPSRVPFAVCG